MTSTQPAAPKSDHPILPLFLERWSPYAFDSRPVEREKLLSCLEAARWAPSSYNEQPWTFIVAERTDTAEFARMIECLVEGNRAWAKNAGVVMLTVVSKLFVKNGKPNAAAEHDIGLAAENLVLQATALGLQGHQMIGVEHGKARATYSIPEGHQVLTAIALGYPVAVPSNPTDPLQQRDVSRRLRKPLSEIVIRGAWGKPANLS